MITSKCVKTLLSLVVISISAAMPLAYGSSLLNSLPTNSRWAEDVEMGGDHEDRNRIWSGPDQDHSDVWAGGQDHPDGDRYCMPGCEHDRAVN